MRRSIRGCAVSLLVALLLGPAPVLLVSGRAAADASLQSGDLLVGIDAEQPGQGAVGAIVRVRDGQVSTFCQSPQPGSPGTSATDVFGVPTSVMVDSAGNVVFLANPRFGAGGTALFRCSTLGQVPEKLAAFPGDPSEVAGTGYPIPFGSQSFPAGAGSVFLKPAVSMSITDSGVNLAKGIRTRWSRSRAA